MDSDQIIAYGVGLGIILGILGLVYCLNTNIKCSWKTDQIALNNGYVQVQTQGTTMWHWEKK